MYQPNYGVNGLQNPVPQNYNQPNLQMQPVQQPIKYNRNAFMGLGSTQIVIAVICFILSIILSINGSFFAKDIAVGFWSGLFFFISGLLTLLVGVNTNARPSLINGALVMNIISAIAAIACLSMGFIIALLTGTYDRRTDAIVLNPYDVVIGPIFITLAIIEAILSITCSALCCQAHCCCTSTHNDVIIQGYPVNLSYPNNSGHVIMQPQQPYPQITQPQQPQQPQQLQQLPAKTK